MKKDEEDC